MIISMIGVSSCQNLRVYVILRLYVFFFFFQQFSLHLGDVCTYMEFSVVEKGVVSSNGLISKARDIPQHDSPHKTAFSIKQLENSLDTV